MEEIIHKLEHLLQYKNKIREAVVLYDAEHFDSGAGFSTLQRVDELYEVIESVIENLQRRKGL